LALYLSFSFAINDLEVAIKPPKVRVEPLMALARTLHDVPSLGQTG
jgi:hypothetical protein